MLEILMHGYHVGLLSVVESKEIRIACIKRDKPVEEHKLRLELLQAVPLSFLPSEVFQAAVVQAKAVEEHEKAFDEAFKEEVETKIARFKSWIEAGRIQDAAAKNFRAICAKHEDELEVLHQKLCVSIHPDCSWDGKRILVV